MSPELIAILSVGVAIVGLLLVHSREHNARIDRLETNINTRFDGLDTRLRAVETGLAELKGQMTIVRDYIWRRNSQDDDSTAEPAE